MWTLHTEETGLFLSVLVIFQPDSRSSKDIPKPPDPVRSLHLPECQPLSFLRETVGSRECGRGLRIPAMALLRLSGSKDGSSGRPTVQPMSGDWAATAAVLPA